MTTIEQEIKTKLPDLIIYPEEMEPRKLFLKDVGHYFKDIGKHSFFVEKRDDKWFVKSYRTSINLWQKRIKRFRLEDRVEMHPLEPMELLKYHNDDNQPSGVYLDGTGTFWCDRIVIKEIQLSRLEKVINRLSELGMHSHCRNVFQNEYGEYDIICMFDTPLPSKMHKKLQSMIGDYWFAYRMVRNGIDHGGEHGLPFQVFRKGWLSKSIFESIQMERFYGDKKPYDQLEGEDYLEYMARTSKKFMGGV